MPERSDFIKRLFAGLYLAFIFLFLYLPIAILIIFSFNSSKTRGHWTGFSLKWYDALLHDSAVISAMTNTLLIAVIATVIATIIGTFAAIGLYYMKKSQRRLILALNQIPVLNPDIVTAISLMVLFHIFHLNLGLFSLTLAHIIFLIPYVLLSIMPRLNTMESSLPEAALDLGATPGQCVYKIILPEIKPAILQSALLAFTLSIDDFVISFFTGGNGVSTVATHVFSMTRRGINPVINALSTVMFLITLLLLIIINYQTARKAAGETSGDIQAELNILEPDLNSDKAVSKQNCSLESER